MTNNFPTAAAAAGGPTDATAAPIQFILNGDGDDPPESGAKL